VRHAVRATLHQPMLRALCRRAGRRLLLDPGTGLPVIWALGTRAMNDVVSSDQY